MTTEDRPMTQGHRSPAGIVDDPLDTLRALEAAATKGPWTRERTSLDVFDQSGASPLRTFRGSMVEQVSVNLDLVCAARNALPALLTIAEAAQELLAVDWHADAPVPSVATLTFDFRGDRSALARAVDALLAASTAKVTLP